MIRIMIRNRSRIRRSHLHVCKSGFVCSLLLLSNLVPRASVAQPQPGDHLPKIRIGKDSRTFVTDTGKPFMPFGVTYYRPGTGWAPQVWKRFDAEATRKDFARMKELGVNCARVFLTYGSFYS